MNRLLYACLASLCAAPALAAEEAPRAAGPPDAVIKAVRLDQKLNEQVPLDLEFRDDGGRTVRLGDYFGKKPVMLMLIQFRCTMLCSEELNVLLDSLKKMSFVPGREFELLTVSIDDRETPDLAADLKKNCIERYRRPEGAGGWHFLTGDKTAIRRLADAIGFHFVYDAPTDQFAHPDGVLVLTPKGRIARYYFRLEYPPRDLRFGLIEATGGRIGTPLDAIALLCYHYNPVTGKYAVAFMGVLRLAAVATVAGLLMGVAMLKRRDRRGARALAGGG